jgi:hypothetical protein
MCLLDVCIQGVMGGGHYMAAVKDGGAAKRVHSGGVPGGSETTPPQPGIPPQLEAQSSHGSVTSTHSVSSGDDTPPAHGAGSATGTDTGVDRWFLYNDHVVTKIDEHEVCNEDAYLLFYMRRDMRGVGLDRWVYPSSLFLST